MGILEEESRQRTRRNDLRLMILSTIKVAGVLGLFMVAPNVLGGMEKLGLLPSTRQKDVVNRSCNQLVRQGLLIWEGKKLRLTPKGESALRSLELKRYDIPKPRRWDKKWRVLIFDIPEKQRALRNRIRDTLRAIGFMRLQGSVWVYPYDCEDLITLLKADFHVGRSMLYMVVDALEYDTRLRQEFGLKK
ncbi:CRISPR-associated endonuclease Cas2 [Candidatus Kaiserbacteria bacterium RIFCSPHIGHO2_02_FULL_55_20]|uniref:CRISPR-associated endonuclease Cas2 n=1 Tax=Candidatus Kaiserbacteria bacterium RIFCSPHIGHO2_02_FULL_55_20 TaxID=1798497 RepID=A0A1F6DWG9_9BACT|nr:MAG: CRISPR-associated endonuclease Cas2 [Candidatus Kaiserbacteria bacterium RIFCSPHIGHO2_02_FULL_55_20]